MTASLAPVAPLATAEERSFPLATYILMLLGVVTGVTAALALIMALTARRDASEIAQSHYDFIIQTFWVALYSVAMVLVLAGLFSVMEYAWLPSLGRLLFLLVSVWVVVRSAIAVLRLCDGDGMAVLPSLGVPERIPANVQACAHRPRAA